MTGKSMARNKQEELFEDIFDCLANNNSCYRTSREEFDEKYEDWEFEIDYTNHIITFTDENNDVVLTITMQL